MESSHKPFMFSCAFTLCTDSGASRVAESLSRLGDMAEQFLFGISREQCDEIFQYLPLHRRPRAFVVLGRRRELGTMSAESGVLLIEHVGDVHACSRLPGVEIPDVR